MTEHIETRAKIKNIADINCFDNLLESSTLNAQQKKIIRMFYIEDASISDIADSLKLSESTVKRRHRNALEKISKLL